MIRVAAHADRPAALRPTLASSPERDLWDRFVEQAAGGTIFQSYDWGEARSRSGWMQQRLRVTGRSGTTLAAVQLGLRKVGPLRILYGQRGPVWKCRAGLEQLLADVQRFAREAGVAFVKLNPDLMREDPLVDLFLDAGYLPTSTQAYMHSATYRIDLSQEEDRWLASMEGRTRRAILRSLRDHVEIEAGSDAQTLARCRKLLLETAKRRRFAGPSQRFLAELRDGLALSDRFHTTIASVEGIDVAGAIHLTFADRSSYMWGGSTSDPRIKRCCATERVQFEAMRSARFRGAREYDLQGVPLDESGKPTGGIALFKRGFGGRLCRLVGDLDLPVHRGLYHIWRTMEPLYLRRKGGR